MANNSFTVVLHLICNSALILTLNATIMRANDEDFDVYSDQKLPQYDILVAADVLYNSDLAKRIGLRLYESVLCALSGKEARPRIIITDSQKFHGTDFLIELKELRELNEALLENGMDQLQWEDQNLQNVVGSGVLLDEDLVYNVDVRLLSWGWATETR
jgi:hypothetical protein